MTKRWMFLPLILGLLSGCLSDELVVGSGKLIVKEREAVPFENVVVDSSFGRFYIEQGKKEAVKIEADDNLAELFSTEIESGTLTIKLEGNKLIKSTLPVKVYVTMKTINSLTVNGSSSMQSLGVLNIDALKAVITGSGSLTLDLKGRSLDLTITGSGDADIEGEVDVETVSIAGSGRFHGQSLISKEADVTINGAGEVLVNVQKTLKAKIIGSGAIRYRGNPHVEQTVEGSGFIDKQD